MMWTQYPAITCIYRTPYVIIVKSVQTVSLQHMTAMNIYSSVDAANILHILLVTAVCLYIQTLLAYDRVQEKCQMGMGGNVNEFW